MTHKTEQERALADLRHMYAQMVGGMVKDSAQAKRIADGILSRAIQKLEQAARRAPAAPVPQGLREAAQRAHDWMDSQADSQSKGNFHSFDLLCLRQERDALAEALAAAPQPPEADMGIPISAAAPVQLPDCAGKVLSDPDYDDGSISWRGGMPPAAGTKLYTEQQVCELLAQHARAPLTENQWQKLWEEWFDGPGDAEDLIRSIERAHGIQEQST